MDRNRLIAVIVLLVLALAAVPAAAHAATINVSTTGNDSTGNGSAALPYRTIGKAASVATTADVVSLAAGLYNEDVTITVPLTLTGAGRDVTTIKGTGTRAAIVSTAPVNTLLSLSGLTVTGGNGTAGGGLYSEAADLSLTDAAFVANQASVGGGVFSPVGTTTVTRCVFDRNQGSAGGGMFCTTGGLTVSDSTFTANSSPVGAGIFHGSVSTMRVVRSVFRRNNAIMGAGGGIYSNCSTAVVSDCEFVDNLAMTGGGCLLSAPGYTLFSGNTVRSNISMNGGGLFDASKSYDIIGNTFSANIGLMGGGGVMCSDGLGRAVNNSFDRNVGMMGAGLMSSGSTVAVVNSTFAGNRGADMIPGTALYAPGSPSTVSNSVFWGNEGTAAVSASVTVSNCDVQDPTPGVGNFTADPLFQDASTGDVQLSNGSPCIDKLPAAGAPATDLAGAPRPLDGNGDGVAAVDVGCYERPYMAINNNAISASSTAVTINSAFPGATQMRIDAGRGWGPWLPYAAVTSTILPGDGTRTVDVEFLYPPSAHVAVSDSILVARPLATLSKPRVRPTSARRGARFTITGTVKPFRTGAKTTLYITRKVGATWRAFKTVRVTDTRASATTGKYTYGIRVTARGRYAVRAFQPLSADNLATYSATAGFLVR